MATWGNRSNFPASWMSSHPNDRICISTSSERPSLAEGVGDNRSKGRTEFEMSRWMWLQDKFGLVGFDPDDPAAAWDEDVGELLVSWLAPLTICEGPSDSLSAAILRPLTLTSRNYWVVVRLNVFRKLILQQNREVFYRQKGMKKARTFKSLKKKVW